MFNFDVNQLTEQMKPAMDKFATTLGTTADKLLEIGVNSSVINTAASDYALLLKASSLILNKTP